MKNAYFHLSRGAIKRLTCPGKAPAQGRGGGLSGGNETMMARAMSSMPP
jgi:hypothetical protein